MKKFKLFKRVITFSIYILLLLFFFIFGLSRVDISQNHIDKPVDIIIVVGGGLGSRIERAWKLQEDGCSRSDHILITGIPFNPNRVIDRHPFLRYLQDHPYIRYRFISISETQNSWSEAIYIQKYMSLHQYKSVAIVTHPLHSGRLSMAIDSVMKSDTPQFDYHIIGDREIDIWNDFFTNKDFRKFALYEVFKRYGYEIKNIYLHHLSI